MVTSFLKVAYGVDDKSPNYFTLKLIAKQLHLIVLPNVKKVFCQSYDRLTFSNIITQSGHLRSECQLYLYCKKKKQNIPGFCICFIHQPTKYQHFGSFYLTGVYFTTGEKALTSLFCFCDQLANLN